MAKEGEALSSKNEPPGRIGKYAIVGRIGQGAMGQVFRAHDSILNREVAIKMMVADVSADPLLSQRFLREAQSAARLNHPNIVTLHDFGEDQGQFFMAMELLEGHDLSALIKQRRLVTLEDKLALMEQVCDGLAYAHSMQVVHRDLKPANIHVSKSGRVKIMDFGLARIAGSDMTRAGTIMGSPNYMSPEQVRGEQADARSDVFALGAVFYEVLSGRRAFDAEAMHAILYKVANAEPDPLALLCPDVPVMVIEFIEKALNKDAAQRFADALEMREALELCQRVIHGGLDEEEGLASLRESRTIVESPAPAEAARPEDAPTISAAAPTRPAIARRGASGSQPFVRLGRPGSQPGTAASPRTAVGSGLATVSQSPVSGAPPAMPSAPSVVVQSKTPLYAAIGIGMVAIGLALFAALRTGRAPVPAATDGRASALVAVAVESQLEVARKSLEFKDLEGAIAAADKALRLDPKSAEAQTIRDRARGLLDAVEADVREAREAARTGDTEKATQALSRVLAQVPQHPVAAELAAQLDSRFRSRAEEALGQMRAAADSARRSGASSLREYADAVGLARQAQDLFGQRQYTEATQRALAAATAYGRARAVAAELAARPTPPPPTSAAAPTPAPATPPPATAPPATRPAPTPPPATAPPVSAGPSAETLVRRVIADFGRAIETKDVALYKSVRPGLSGDDERKLRAAFESVRSQEVDLTVQSVSIDGSQAVVHVLRAGRVNGQQVPTQPQTFRLVKRPSGWVIEDIGQ